MVKKPQRCRRHGAHAVECAIVFPLAFFIVLATFIGAVGVFQYQQVASLAREAARYASTHGGQYQRDYDSQITAGTLPNVTEEYIRNNIVLPKCSAMDTSQLLMTITFNQPSGSTAWDSTANRYPNTIWTDPNSGTQYSVTNTVTVTVTYTWAPFPLLSGTYTLSSTSVMPMCY
jgi:Flp pilus assembly protein TadG